MTNALGYDLSGEGPVLLVFHGITENRHFWDPVPLNEHFRTLRVDARGHGTSTRDAPSTAAATVDDAHALLTELVGEEVPIVLGHSFGGLLATMYASKYPAQAVINVDQPLIVAPFPPEVAEVVRHGDVDGMYRTLLTSMYGELPDEAAAALDRARAVERPVILDAVAPLLELSPQQLDAFIDDALRIPATVPYLSLHGTPAPDGYEQWLTARLPQATVESTTARSHYPHLVDPATFTARLRSFVGA
jgi:pimeloyl-ACP methyl ester carboxylesterase